MNVCDFIKSFVNHVTIYSFVISNFVRFGLVWLGISTVGGYLKPNPVYRYILNI